MNLGRKLILFSAFAATATMAGAVVSYLDQYIDFRTNQSNPARARPIRQTPPVTAVHTAIKLGLGTTRGASRTRSRLAVRN